MTQNPPFPSPEELKAKLSEFMKTNFGDKVAFTTYTEPDAAPAPAEEKPSPPKGDEPFVFDFLPRDIKAHLDRFVIKQDEAKKVLSIAVCDHYNHVNYLRQLEKEDPARMEETDVPLRSANDIQAQLQAAFEFQRRGGKAKRETISTRHILFVVSGAFERLKQQVSRRLTQGQIGFNAEPRHLMDNELFEFVNTQDFIEYGFEPEFIGRLPVRVVCEELAAEDLYQIMKYSEGSILRQYERAFRAYGIEISFEDEALHLMAEAAAKEKTGARGLLTVWEKLFRDYKYYLAGSGLSQLRVTAELVREPKKVLDRLMVEGHKQEEAALERSARAFAQEFEKAHGLEIVFDPHAIARLVERAHAERMTMPDLCAHLFKDYQFGLSLVQKNTGQRSFVLGRGAVDAPDKFLSDLVVQSHYPAK